MNYFTLIEDIKRTSLQFAEEFYEGDVYEFLNSGNHKYPSIILTTQNVSTTDNINSISGTLFCVDRLTDDSSNRLEIQSNAFNKLQRIISALEENTINLQSNTYTPFTEKFADLCGGMFVEFSFQYVGESICDDLEIKEIELTQNGIYDVIGYDRAIVNVRPVVNLEDITITDNGEYTCGEGFDGFGKVNVDLKGKVKVNGLATLTNSCLNENGEWEYGKLLDWSTLTSIKVASSTNNLKRFDYPFMDTSNVTSFELCFRRCTQLKYLDIRGWDFGKVSSDSQTHLFHEHYALPTVIGDCTLEDVENNGVTVYDNCKVNTGFYYMQRIRYSSLLAAANGVADVSELETAKSFIIDDVCWNSMWNDDDTKPSAEIIAQRQNKLTEILTNKNWTIVLY